MGQAVGRDVRLERGRRTAMNGWNMLRLCGTILLPGLVSPGWAEGTLGRAPVVCWHEDLGRGVLGGPVTDADFCVVPLVDGKLACLRLPDGEILWRRKPCRSIVAPAVIHEDRVYGAGVDAKDPVFCIHLHSGRLEWRKQAGGVLAGLCVAADAVIAVARDGTVTCLEAKDGQARWRTPVSRLALFPPVAAGSGVLIPSLGDSLFRLALRTGECIWAVEIPGGVAGAPLVLGDTVFVASQTGRVAALAVDDASPF